MSERQATGVLIVKSQFQLASDRMLEATDGPAAVETETTMTLMPSPPAKEPWRINRFDQGSVHTQYGCRAEPLDDAKKRQHIQGSRQGTPQ